MRRESSSPFTRPVPLPLWAAVAIPVSAAVLAGAVGLASGVLIGRAASNAPAGPGAPPAVVAAPDATPAAKADPKTYLRDPVNKDAFRAAMMGRSTREVTKMLGPPKWVLNNPDVGLGWGYPVNLSPDGKKWSSSVILMIRNDHVTEITW